jgi:hypothetical protein
MSFIIDYLGIIAVVLTAIFVYKKFKSGWFVKKETDSVEIQEPKPQSRFQRWWIQSYIREIYVVRASQRKSACFIPWMGVAISTFFVFSFFVFSYIELMNPIQSIEKLTKYNGVVKGYVYRQKSDDILIVQLPSAEKKYFHTVLRQKEEVVDAWMNKNVTVWAQQNWGLTDLGYYEQINWLEMEGKPVDEAYGTYEQKFSSKKNMLNKFVFPNLLHSLTWLLGFLALLWFINRNPVNQTTTITNNKNQIEGE